MCRGAAKLGATGGDCPPREGAGGGEAERRGTLARVRVRGVASVPNIVCAGASGRYWFRDDIYNCVFRQVGDYLICQCFGARLRLGFP